MDPKEYKAKYTPRQRLANWLHYNKLWLLAVLVVLWVVGTMLWNILGIGQPRPDCSFVYIGSRQLPQDCVLALEQALSSLAEDYNGDGTVTVVLTQCLSTDSSSVENQLHGYGSEVSLLADITDGESHFFLMEDPDDVQLSFQILANLDGSIPAEDDFGGMDKVYAWSSCPRLAALELGTYTDTYLDQVETGSCQDLLSGLYLGRRYYYDASMENYPQGYEALWKTLTEGATP